MKKVVIVIIAIILVVVLGIFCAKKMQKDEEKVETVGNAIENIAQNTIENDVANNEITNNIIEEENTVSKETEKPEENLSDEEKAKAIVKKDWGEDNKVYFTVDGSNGNGEFTVCVRESATTKILYRYTVNINTGEFSSELEAH